jgi:hypothetical protein
MAPGDDARKPPVTNQHQQPPSWAKSGRRAKVGAAATSEERKSVKPVEPLGRTCWATADRGALAPTFRDAAEKSVRRRTRTQCTR